MKRLPSLDSPFIATKIVPGRTRRESYSTPVTAGFPLWERTSAPCRRGWNVIGVILLHDAVYGNVIQACTYVMPCESVGSLRRPLLNRDPSTVHKFHFVKFLLRSG